MAAAQPEEERPGGTVEVEPQDHGVVVRPHGAVAELEAQEVARRIDEEIQRGRVRIVVDLSDVTFLTSTCLGSFMAAHKRCLEKGGYLRLVRPQPLVRQVLETTKLDRLFGGPYDSVREALEAP